nr:MAG TPA: hypothetical protein [Caudoviricetes sp.]
MENNFEKALKEAAKKFRIFIAISLFIRLLFSPIFFIFYLIKNLCERVFDFCIEIKICFLKSFVKPIKKYRRFMRNSNEENLNKKIEFQKFREEQF